MKCREVKRREKIFMEKQNFPEKQTWGTWEGLLLACTVHRFGWDSFKLLGFRRRFHKQLPQWWSETQRIELGLQISVVTTIEQKISVKYRKYGPDLTVNKNIVRRYRRPIWIRTRKREHRRILTASWAMPTYPSPIPNIFFSSFWAFRFSDSKKNSVLLCVEKIESE